MKTQVEHPFQGMACNCKKLFKEKSTLVYKPAIIVWAQKILYCCKFALAPIKSTRVEYKNLPFSVFPILHFLNIPMCFVSRTDPWNDLETKRGKRSINQSLKKILSLFGLAKLLFSPLKVPSSKIRTSWATIPCYVFISVKNRSEG
jgi:hypothetical protein